VQAPAKHTLEVDDINEVEATTKGAYMKYHIKPVKVTTLPKGSPSEVI
jgi:hypothetical protein